MNDDLLAVVRDIESPPGGWKYTVPQTGVTITDGWFRGLWKKVQSHYAANGIEVGDDFREIVEHGACCETRPPGSWCSKRKPKPVAGKHPALTLIRVNRFLATMWQVIRRREFVSQEEAERRAAICLACPLATGEIGGCKSCASLLKKVDELVSSCGSLFPEDKRVCGACGCYLPVKCLISNKTLDKAEGSERPAYAPGCWRLEGTR